MPIKPKKTWIVIADGMHARILRQDKRGAPLAPALDGLARGDVDALTDNLRLAFSITVLGILIGVLALGLSLVRERLYGQDFSDLEYIAAVLTDDGTGASAVAPVPTRPAPTATLRDPAPLTPKADLPPLSETTS